MIKMELICKEYENNVRGVKNISLHIEPKEFVFLIGKNGAGKSTLLKLITQEIHPTSGTLIVNNLPLSLIDNKEFPYFRRQLGIINKEIGLLENKTVYQNLELVLRATEQPSKIIRKNIPMALALVGLSEKLHAYPNTLSAGEYFRVLMARAVINNPTILIADEPTANLDYETAWDIMQLFQDINHLGITILIATHAKEFVDVMNKRVIALHNGRVLTDVKKGKYGRIL